MQTKGNLLLFIENDFLSQFPCQYFTLCCTYIIVHHCMCGRCERDADLPCRLEQSAPQALPWRHAVLEPSSTQCRTWGCPTPPPSELVSMGYTRGPGKWMTWLLTVNLNKTHRPESQIPPLWDKKFAVAKANSAIVERLLRLSQANSQEATQKVLSEEGKRSLLEIRLISGLTVSFQLDSISRKG